MTVVASVSSSSAYDRRRAIAEDADAKQTRIVADSLSAGFAIDWQAVLNVADAKDVLRSIEQLLREDLRRDSFSTTIATLGMNGKLLASFVQREHEILAGVRGAANLVPLSFAEATLSAPQSSLAYWKRVLQLSDRQASEVEAWVRGFLQQERAAREAISDELMRQLEELLSRALTGEQGVAGFLRRAREVMPQRSASVLENEYRTHLSRVYGDDQHAQIVSRQNVFPFAQFFNPKDSRTTWWICLPMAKAVSGRGYICASTDPVVRKWRCPNHHQCRSMWSPIGYRECQRLGIIAADGRTRVAITGNNPDRPYGDPPTHAQNPDPPHETRVVEPAEGFGG